MAIQTILAVPLKGTMNTSTEPTEMVRADKRIQGLGPFDQLSDHQIGSHDQYHSLIDSDFFFIDTVQKYPDDHMKKIEIAKREYNENARPELTDRVDNMADYDTVIAAFPNWWTTMPMAMFTFFESYDFSGKTICPLITHGGSGFSNSLSDIRRLCPGAKITEGLAVNGDDVQSCDRALGEWLRKIGLM